MKRKSVSNTGNKISLWMLLYITVCVIPVNAGTIHVDINDSGCVTTSGQPDPYSIVYCSIENAITDALTGDIIYVSAGTYTPLGGVLNINKSITLAADPSLGVQGPGPMVRPRINTSFSGWSSCAIQIGADGVVLDGFEVDNSAAGSLVGYIIGDYNSPRNGWTVRNCDVHNGRNTIRPIGNNVTIEYNNLHETYSDLINAEYGACYGLKVKYNWLHSHYPTNGGKPAGVTYNCSSTTPGSWADVEIMYNYCWASRTFIDFQTNGGLAPANFIYITHNTVDWWIGALPDPIAGTEQAQQMSIAWWMLGAGTPVDFWNATNFIIKDNLFTRQKWYQIVNTDNANDYSAANYTQGQLVLEKNLFWMWFLRDSWFPSYAKPFEWPAARGAVGWDAPYLGAGNDFVMTDCIAADPLYSGVGSNPDEFYSLADPDSAAYQSATDGTNIGAWQGVFPATVTPTPTDTQVPTDTPTETPSDTPTTIPSVTPTSIPTDTPSPMPTLTPSESPTAPPLPASSPAGIGMLLLIFSAMMVFVLKFNQQSTLS